MSRASEQTKERPTTQCRTTPRGRPPHASRSPRPRPKTHCSASCSYAACCRSCPLRRRPPAWYACCPRASYHPPIRPVAESKEHAHDRELHPHHPRPPSAVLPASMPSSSLATFREREKRGEEEGEGGREREKEKRDPRDSCCSDLESRAPLPTAGAVVLSYKDGRGKRRLATTLACRARSDTIARHTDEEAKRAW